MSRVGVVGRQLLHQLHGRNVSTPTDVKMSDDGVTVVEVLVQMHEVAGRRPVISPRLEVKACSRVLLCQGCLPE